VVCSRVNFLPSLNKLNKICVLCAEVYLSDVMCGWRLSSLWYVNGFSSSSDSKMKAISNLPVKRQESNSRIALGHDVLISSRGMLLRMVLRVSWVVCVYSLRRTRKLNTQFGCV
jgi:hypothetical protein